MKKRWIVILLGILLLLLILIQFFNRPVNNHPFFNQFENYPLVFSHADDSGNGLWPGNTLLYLQGVADLGVDVLEFDVNLTKDGTLILMHDRSVDRTTDGIGEISDLTLDEVQALEVGVNWTQDNGATYPYIGQGLRVPTLEEVFQEFPDYPMNIELKQPGTLAASPLCSLIYEYGKQDQVLIASSQDEAMNAFRAECPDVATAGSTNEVRNFVILNFLLLSNLAPLNFQAFQVPENSSGIPVVIPHFINSANRRNVQVHVWTVNDPDDMERFINMGVHGIMTDRPDILLEILGRE